jgi:hypothetical protein
MNNWLFLLLNNAAKNISSFFNSLGYKSGNAELHGISMFSFLRTAKLFSTVAIPVFTFLLVIYEGSFLHILNNFLPVFQTGSHYVAQDGLELSILLPHPPEPCITDVSHYAWLTTLFDYSYPRGCEEVCHCGRDFPDG